MATPTSFIFSQIVGSETESKNTNVKKNNKNKMPWVDKYRPRKINDIVYQDEIVSLLKQVIKTGNLPHLAFFGPPGTGKTSTILALSYELFGPRKFRERVIELNASDERGINIVRNEIITFAKSSIGEPDLKYPCPPFKIIILDEADAMTAEAQSALRKVMEDTSKITRFCIICNYVDKIIEPINSRCMRFRFKPICCEQMKKKLLAISVNEKMNIPINVLDNIVDLSDGDMRKGIMTLQNIKYLIKINKNINTVDIYEFMSFVPPHIVCAILDKCIHDTSNDIENIVCLATKFHAQGYHIYNFMEQVSKYILSIKILSDKQKSLIFIRSMDTMIKLNEGADEYIQLLQMLVYIKTTSNLITKI